MYKNNKQSSLRYLKEISQSERKAWKPQRQKVAFKILEAFLDSDIIMAEVKLDDLSEPVHRDGKKESTKQDSFASSFYAWKRKKRTQEVFKEKGIDILLIRRRKRIALKKIVRNKKRLRRKG